MPRLANKLQTLMLAATFAEAGEEETAKQIMEEAEAKEKAISSTKINQQPVTQLS